MTGDAIVIIMYIIHIAMGVGITAALLSQPILSAMNRFKGRGCAP